LHALEKRFDELNNLLSQPDVIADQPKFQKLAKEHASLKKIVDTFQLYKKNIEALSKNEVLLKDETQEKELRELAEEERKELRTKLEKIEFDLKTLLTPKDSRDEKNIILEIRAGTGGEEAALFAANLFRMYSKYAEQQGWRVGTLSSNVTGKGGFKEIISSLEGKNVFSFLKYESGTHRVQRVPETEASGRIHTSAVTVAILPEAEEIDIEIDPNDIKVDIFRSSGPGGQSVNTTDSAVRMTHILTGITVSCQDEKSQHKNKAKALKVLRARLLDAEERKSREERSSERKAQVGSGDRSERIRTYNFPQERVTDHRIGLTIHKLSSMMDGNLDELLEKLQIHFQAEAMKQRESNELPSSKPRKVLHRALDRV
jgi:peptide chain release factor 1